jgi:hypothetical protein
MKWIAPAALTLALSTTSGVLAQDRARDRVRDPAADQDRVADRDRVQDRDQDRLQDRDRLQDQDRTRDQDRDRDGDRDRDRLQLHVQDREQLRDHDIYGSQLMTREERNEYRRRIEAMSSVQDWARFRAEHQNRMLARARERNADLEAPYYGQQLITDQEREQLRERLRNAASEQERARIRAENREQIQQRAREYQIPLAELGTP